jgi:SAM-dependent methyltransferase
MSLLGRRLIDKLKRAVSSRITLPVPPYGSPAYWDKTYSKLEGKHQIFEWGDLDFEEQLHSYTFRLKEELQESVREHYGEDLASCANYDKDGSALTRTESFRETIQVPEITEVDNRVIDADAMDNEEEHILFLGCGLSRMGESVLQYYHQLKEIGRENNDITLMKVPKIIQCDVSPHVVTIMSELHEPYIKSRQMVIFQDDATQLSLVEDSSMSAVVDKGLIDALFCSNDDEQIHKIIKNVHRSLKVGKVFLFFSFSRPEFLLPNMANIEQNAEEDNLYEEQVSWEKVEVRELDQIFMYVFVKGAARGLKNKSLRGKPFSKKKRRGKN